MPYLHQTPEERESMLRAIGVASVDELFESLADETRLTRPLNIPPALSELELTQTFARLAERNQHAGQLACFLGAGSYDHFVPAIVDTVAARSEFYTSYTPYQAEVSQGNLQVMFEYQSLIARLTGMEVSNASVYDGASATAEAVLMAMSCSRRHDRAIVLGSVHPEYRETIHTYLANLPTELVTVDAPQGVVDPGDLSRHLDPSVACVVVQQPNFFGCLEQVQQIAEQAHEAGALLIVCVDPISLGLLKRPGDYGADIVVAEGQSLGTPMSYGGPYLGVMACRQRLVRRMPGRIAGQTVDRKGRRSFVLTLQTREQHIRRDKATSNICTNQGLFALRASVYLAAMGPQGMRDVAQLCLNKARYAALKITENPRFRLEFSHPTFKEFVIRDTASSVTDVLESARHSGFLAGVPLARWYPELSDCFLVAVTEKRTRQEIDALASALATSSEPAPSHA